MAGTRIYRIRIEQATESRNSLGEVVKAWVPYLVCYAAMDVQPVSERYAEQFAAQQYAPRDDVIFTTQYDRGVTAKMRIRHEQKLFDIAGVHPDAKRREMALRCVSSGFTERVP